MRVKDSTVKMDKLCKEITDKLPKLDAIHRRYFKTELVITSGNDGRHMQNSFHYRNKAIDIRTMDIKCTIAVLVTFLNDIGTLFAASLFDVTFEGDHIHIEYDPGD
jgi:hypothetical protein